jgi:hypothetical protein
MDIAARDAMRKTSVATIQQSFCITRFSDSFIQEIQSTTLRVQKMKFPSELEFLESFGIEPVEVDASMAYCRYVKTSENGASELDFSFSAISKSFQVVLRSAGHEMVSVSSENASLIEIRSNQRGLGIHVVFDTPGGKSEAEVTLEPNLHCSWWYLRD